MAQAIPTDIEAAEGRRAAFIAAIPASLRDMEEALPAILAHANTSPRSKLKRIYKLVDDLARIRAPHVACQKGCADCCHMNVQISALEAQTISAETGIAVKQINASIGHPVGAYVGVPCPFLLNDSCSIYEMRPLACRKHSSFHSSSAWCERGALLEVQVPMIEMSGVDRAFAEVSASRGSLVVADIRNFFGS